MGAPILILVLLAALTDTCFSGVDEDPVFVSNQQFMDSQGRARHFRGVNVVYKDPPYFPDLTSFHPSLSFVEPDVQLLVSLGVNLIRLGVMWPGVYPSPNLTDSQYIASIRAIIRLCAAHKVYVIVEPHQDELNPQFCGEGAPNWWARANTRVTDFPVPVQSARFNHSVPFRSECLSHSSFSYIWTHDAARSYQTLWDSRGRGGFAEYWKRVALELSDEWNVIGGEIFNEPFPGDVFQNPEIRNNTHADLTNLQPFYQAITNAVRSVVPSRRHFALAFEPSWPVGTQDIEPSSILAATSGFEHLPEPDSIYAFHYYSAPCTTNLSEYLDERLVDAARLGGVPFASEFNLGASDKASEVAMTDTFNQFEQRLISFTGWQYKSYSGSLPNGTCTGCGNSFFDHDNPNMFMQRSIARPFASAVAGTVTEINLSSDQYSLQYAPRMDLDGGETVIVVPGVWGTEFNVSVDGNVSVTREVVHGRLLAPKLTSLGYCNLIVRHEQPPMRMLTVVEVMVTVQVSKAA